MKCEYCGKPIEEGQSNCVKCGAPVSVRVEAKKPNSEKHSPFYYHGFMLWPETHYERDSFEYHIWLGDRLIGSFELTRPMIDTWREENRIDEGCEAEDSNSLLYKMLRLAVGETEVERWQQLNIPRRFMYEMRRMESEEYAQARQLVRELMQVPNCPVLSV